jgi:hypothetical protein
MPEQVDQPRVAESVSGESTQRWDVGLGERLAQTIWRWLGREAVSLPEAPRDPEPVRYRKAA